jgi:hypothetical protein
MKKALLLLIIFLLIPVSIRFDNAVAAEATFTAELHGSNEVPPVKSAASGEATFTVVDNGNALRYKVTVDSLENVTAAHIHMGKADENGPVLVFLFRGPEKKEVFSGVLAEGTIKASDLFDTLKGKSVADLIAKMKAGDTYVNVHTTQNPPGEIRGQIK